jgi:hypothetical protein
MTCYLFLYYFFCVCFSRRELIKLGFFPLARDILRMSLQELDLAHQEAQIKSGKRLDDFDKLVCVFRFFVYNCIDNSEILFFFFRIINKQ